MLYQFEGLLLDMSKVISVGSIGGNQSCRRFMVRVVGPYEFEMPAKEHSLFVTAYKSYHGR